MAALLLLERLSPLERAVFVLREVFGCGFPEIASAVGRSEAAWRHVDAVRPRFEAGRAKREELAGRFLDAFRSGDVGALTKLLAADVQLVGDGGGKAPQWASRFTGAGAVAGVLAKLMPLSARIGCQVSQHAQGGPYVGDRGQVCELLRVLHGADRLDQSVHDVRRPDADEPAVPSTENRTRLAVHRGGKRHRRPAALATCHLPLGTPAGRSSRPHGARRGRTAPGPRPRYRQSTCGER
ncbi:MULTISPECIES: sigma factor-like helix-turn-helix DNA-binding protein [Amycolatopsis]|uniref:sigma factor-like helix-turn-helix DNA-binding protein n=1 Tax=Amycolatopsis TaxID=1813 RepID=UPI001F082897|nr:MULTISPECIES: sigma factor-like helix-turn-helix DNA-binding protein [Amycolatopsis]